MTKLMKEAGLSESVCVFWNAVPWALGGRRRPNAAELERGAWYLKELVALLPDLRAVLALGRDAQRACALAGVVSINVCHPSPLGLYGGGANRVDEHRAGLARAAALAQGREKP
jgi:uracil-DNA glycosylase